MANIDVASFAQGAVRARFAPCYRGRVHTLSTEPSAGDFLRFFKMPDRFKFIECWLSGARLDTHGTPLLSVDLELTDLTTTHTLISAFTGLRSATATTRIARCQLPSIFGKAISGAGWIVRLKWTAVAGTFAAGDVQVGIQYTEQDIVDGK